jgi:hypothetical protein
MVQAIAKSAKLDDDGVDCQDHDLLGRDFCVIRFRALDFCNTPKLRFGVFG